MAHGLHVGENAGTGGGEAGDGLEHGVHEPGDLPGEHEGQRAEDTHQDPAQGRGHAAVLQIKVSVFWGLAAHQPADDHAGRRHGKIGPALAFPVDQTHQEAGQHQKTLDPQHIAQDIDDH